VTETNLTNNRSIKVVKKENSPKVAGSLNTTIHKTVPTAPIPVQTA
jgi:hypothetical protein